MADETTQTMSKVMVITAHPDDAEFMCGGTVAKWAQEGKEIVYVVCTNGNKGTQDPEMDPKRLAQLREQEQRAAAQVLGVQAVEFLGYPDGSLEDTPEVRGKIVRLIRTYRPDIIITQDPLHWQHRDHRMAGTVTLDAVFPYARDHLHYPEHVAEGLEPHKVAEVYIAGEEGADTFIDVTHTFDLKIGALMCHKTQITRPQEEMEKFLREWATRAAEGQDMELAEAFRKLTYRR